MIEFDRSDSNIYWGDGRFGRRWRISPVRTGWRLEFDDPGDHRFTNAGVFADIRAAKAAAAR